MLNRVWPFFIIISFFTALIFGNLNSMNNSILEGANNAVELSIKLLGTMCLWNGIIKIVAETSLIKRVSFLLRPLIKFLFPNISSKDEVHSQITMNMVANILGIGNAATPLGIKVMKLLQEKNKNKDKLTDEMIMFIVINTASIQLIPTTVIAIRSSYGSKNPTSIIIPVWIATICAAIAGVLAVKFFLKLDRKNNKGE